MATLIKSLCTCLIAAAIAILIGSILGEGVARLLYHINNPSIGRHMP